MRKLKASELNAQPTKAFNLVEQGIYTLEIFQQRRDSLTSSIADARDRQLHAEKLLLDYEENEASRNSLIPQTTALLECYEEMSISERNAVLKTILEKIEYRKGKDGNIEIDLYPKFPPQKISRWYHGRTHVLANDPTTGYGIFIENMLDAAA